MNKKIIFTLNLCLISFCLLTFGCNSGNSPKEPNSVDNIVIKSFSVQAATNYILVEIECEDGSKKYYKAYNPTKLNFVIGKHNKIEYQYSGYIVQVTQ